MGTWGAGNSGNDINTGVCAILDNNLAGVSTFSTTSGTVSLSASDVQNCMFRFTGALTGSLTVSPAAGAATTYFNGFYCFENLTSNSFNVTVTTGAGSVILYQGTRGIMFVDGSNGPRVISTQYFGNSASVFTAGSKLAFYNTGPPTGWVQYLGGEVNNATIRIQNGSIGGSGGGASNFTDLFSSALMTSQAFSLAGGGTSVLVPNGGATTNFNVKYANMTICSFNS